MRDFASRNALVIWLVTIILGGGSAVALAPEPNSILAVGTTATLIGGGFIYQEVGPCADWQERYTNAKVEEVLGGPSFPALEAERREEVGDQPLACSTPDVDVGAILQKRYDDAHS